jgi:diaminopimelate decarboxylase
MVWSNTCDHASTYPSLQADASAEAGAKNEAAMVVGHCCESGDLLSCAPGDPETLQTRTMLQVKLSLRCLLPTLPVLLFFIFFLSPLYFFNLDHPCPSSSLFFSSPDFPQAERGDLLVVEGSGAYCAAMSTKHYNSFPEAPELMLDPTGKFHVVRSRQAPEDIYKNEVALPSGLF